MSRNGSVDLNLSIDVSSVNILYGHVHKSLTWSPSQVSTKVSVGVLSVFVQQATFPLCCVCVQLSLCALPVQKCCLLLFCLCLLLSYTKKKERKENASMACLLSLSKRTFQVTLHIRILDSWTKPEPLSFSLFLFTLVVNMSRCFRFCQQTQ